MFSFTEDTVLDPFCGSGTTMIASMRTGRNSIGVELDPKYCRMIALRLESENQDLFSNANVQYFKFQPRKNNPSYVKEEKAHYGSRRVGVSTGMRRAG